MADQTALRKPGEDYVHHFHPKDFLNTYYNTFSGNGEKECFEVFVMRNLHQTFHSGRFKGQRLLDLGTGPSTMSIISASKYFDITCSDYLETCRAELQRWLDDDPEAFDWSPYLIYASKLEEQSSTRDDIASRVRTAVKAVVPCDVTLTNPLHPNRFQPFDVLVSTFCLDSACTTLEEYRSALEHMASLIKPGGGLVLVGNFNGTTYMVGKETFSGMNVGEESFRQILLQCGFVDLDVKKLSMADQGHPSDQSFIFYMSAIKG